MVFPNYIARIIRPSKTNFEIKQLLGSAAISNFNFFNTKVTPYLFCLFRRIKCDISSYRDRLIKPL
jgi:hypothetical protein